MTRSRANALLLLAGAIWGMGFVAQSTAMEALGPMQFVALRFVVSTLVLVPLALWESRRVRQAGQPGLRAGDLGGFLLIGTALCAGMIFQQIGLVTTTVTSSGFLTGVYVVLTPLICWAVLRHQLPWRVWPAAALALFGIALLSGGALWRLQAGDVWTLLGALCWSVQAILVAHFVRSSNRPLTLSAVQFATVAVIASIAALIFEDWTPGALQAAWTQILYAGAISSAIGFTLQVIGQRWTTPSQAVIFLSSEAPFAALFGVLLLGEQPGLPGYLGCVLIFGAMLLAELGPGSRQRSSEPGTDSAAVGSVQ